VVPTCYDAVVPEPEPTCYRTSIEAESRSSLPEAVAEPWRSRAALLLVEIDRELGE